MIYVEVSHNDWRNALHEYFSYDAVTVLQEWYEELAHDQDIAFDPVGIRCDWTEYTIEDLITDYGYIINDTITTESTDEFIAELIEEIKDRTVCIELVNDKFLVHEF